tara:strand:+ start:377 stop:478 length:102 start_codon:yes stop_codon:yes gene_type:complete
MKNVQKYIKLAKDNPKVSIGIVVAVIIILSWVF